jgi:hypothetical protein
MPLELDHVFISVDDALAAEQALADFGVQFGLRAVHRGQGTANVCAFFDNAYLELLSRHDDQELQSNPVRPLGLWERLRWRQTGASPFGNALRTGDFEIPVNTWPYEATFLPPGSHIPIVTARNAWHEPLIFLIPPDAVAAGALWQAPSPHASDRIWPAGIAGAGRCREALRSGDTFCQVGSGASA